MVKQIVAVVGLVIFVSPAIAQQQSASPGTAPSATTAKPSPAAVQPGSILDTNTYPLQNALQSLQAGQASSPVVPSVSAAASSQPVVLHRAPALASAAKMPPTLDATVEPLSDSAKKAVAISDAQRRIDTMPEPGKDGRVTYTFGAGLPTVICSPLHVSIIELQPGETLTGAPAIGDSTRWELLPGLSGEGKSAQPIIILKPHTGGLDTNLVITTNKRVYYLRLVSRDEEYIARVAFAYQEDEDLRWRAFQAEQEQAKQQREDAQVVAPVTVKDDYSNLYFNYQVKGKNPSLMPVRVMDDGDKTYLTMPDAVLHLDLPALVVMNPRLKGEKAQEIVNYRVKGNLFIVDRLFDRAALLIGNGKTAESVDIRRHDPLITFKTSATNAPMVSANGGSK